MNEDKVLIIGGGLAGLTAAIHLRKLHITVMLIEKNEYPKHKVCGEYISNEVIPYLNWLDISIDELLPTRINQLHFATLSGRMVKTNLPLGGFGVSRYALDYLLYQKAKAAGCEMIHGSVEKVDFKEDGFVVMTSDGTIYHAPIVLGAFGKRSNIDIQLDRDFIQKKSPWLAVKAHYVGDFPNDVVGLFNFDGGYCGVSKVEENRINICYLASYDSFKRYKSSEAYQAAVLVQNPQLAAVLKNAQSQFEKPLTISQISFERKKPVDDHVVMIGDTAGLIHPLCGNGMAMAIHSAKIAVETVDDYLNHRIKNRVSFERHYAKKWSKTFSKRLTSGRVLANILLRPKLSEWLFRIVIVLPFLLPIIIKSTHGKPIVISK